jgi:membrane protease YdiL (CAAX protease family)
MRSVRLVGLYFAFVFLGGGLLAPWIYKLVHFANAVLPGLQGVAAKPFPRYVGRSLLMMALAGLVPFMRAARFGSWREVGLSFRSGWLRYLGLGFAVGWLSLACVVLVVLGMGGRQLAAGFTMVSLLKHVFLAGLAAALVAPLEELFFRGVLFGTLRRTFHWTAALGLSSAIYALVHFLERPEPFAQITWASGLVVLGGMAHGFTQVDKMIPGFLNLTLVGMILGLAYQRSGTLHFSIGLHAGWIFWLKTYGFITEDRVGSRVWLFGTSKLIDGWLALLMLGAVFFLVNRRMVQVVPPTGWKPRRLVC